MPMAKTMPDWDKKVCLAGNILQPCHSRGFVMLFDLLSVTAGLAFAVFLLRRRYNSIRDARLLANARKSGVAFNADGHIDAKSTVANMTDRDEETGEFFSGKQARFMELMRVVAEGPKSPDEIRFLIAEGIDPIVRPDGLVYVPCIENEHLSVEGELELTEQDLDHYIAEGHLQQVSM
jgi:hypothetical protein